MGLIPNRGGYLELGGLGFTDTSNIQTISAATFTIYYFDETGGQPHTLLSAAILAADQVIGLSVAGASAPGSYIQIESEVMQVVASLNGGTQYEVTRAIDGTTAVGHAISTPIYPLQSKVAIASFAPTFFGSPASGGWAFPVLLPDARVACAELFVTNSRGDSPTAGVAVTQTIDGGLRTLSGGQYSLEVDGYLAIENGAAPDLVIEATHSVRDIYAVVRQAATDSTGLINAPITIQLNQALPGQSPGVYCTLTIPVTAVVSTPQDGFLLPPLVSGAIVTMDVTSVGVTNPGSDLTLIIRL
jgi:hypothetical protein